MSKGAGVSEAKLEKNRSDFGKASVRNKRRFGSEGEPLVGKAAIFRQKGDRGDLIDRRREEHKAKRGVKTKGVTEAKVDTGKSPEEKEKVRNVRKFGVSHNVSGHGKLRRSLHRMNRGDKKIPGDKSKWMEMESVQVKEADDKAYNYVVSQLKKKYGKDAVLTKHDKIKPPTAAQKKAADAHRAKLAKQDHRDPTEKASDGRYSDRYSNRGSD